MKHNLTVQVHSSIVTLFSGKEYNIYPNALCSNNNLHTVFSYVPFQVECWQDAETACKYVSITANTGIKTGGGEFLKRHYLDPTLSKPVGDTQVPLVFEVELHS